MTWNRSAIQKGTLAGILLFVLFSQALVQAESKPKIGASKGQSVYVPIYSQIYSGVQQHPFFLTATISIRNTDLEWPITVTAADYIDSSGNLIKMYIEKPFSLNPISSRFYVVPQSDKSGGSGASFIIKWKADREVSPPIIESIMIGTQNQQGISFTSRGQVILEE
jgi:hypothetical protein